ncbi:MAG: NAD(P)/FAD-dependent oxidoreductase [Chitinophagaceae bacterium]|nr:NAD(P)/FAD-dependent oxidoreductase [Chitinophagaceae bacterium]
MPVDSTYDVAIVGGGLAGLALSIQLIRQGHIVILFEKEQYPFHKVCGEYISLESWDFLNDLGVDLDGINVPIITKLQVTSVNGKMLEQSLPLGGFGISRYRLDNTLAQIAKNEGVIVMENTKVKDIVFLDEEFIVDTSQQQYHAKMVAGSFGKRSNIDIKWKRPFTNASKNKLNNYIGVKYHIKTDFPADTIALHNFKNGYCGIVKIEADNYNLCYLTTANNLQKSKGDIKEMERHILSQNPHLKKIFTENKIINDNPLTISQISFDKKSQVENHVLMIGDAAGMITPLCGNGMSMALHGSKIAAIYIHDFLHAKITRAEMEQQYTLQWNQQFANRLKMGRRIQRLFGSKKLTNFFLAITKPFPKLINYLVKQTHGNPF